MEQDRSSKENRFIQKRAFRIFAISPNNTQQTLDIGLHMADRFPIDTFFTRRQTDYQMKTAADSRLVNESEDLYRIKIFYPKFFFRTETFCTKHGAAKLSIKWTLSSGESPGQRSA